MTAYDPCAHCEEMMQPYMDRVITDTERAEAEAHLDECTYCRKRYRFEEKLRQFVREAVPDDAMPVELKQQIAGLRTPLQSRRGDSATDLICSTRSIHRAEQG